MNQPVVSLYEAGPGIVQLTMQDHLSKNTFSKELISALITSFDEIKANSSYKVVVLNGYGSYFACGGTQKGLLAAHEGKITFPEMKIHSILLDCKIPVIAAMQGHGIGGGFVMGLFADLVVLSRESIYATNFMRYGFTPGFGATYIVPKKLGLSLAEELLFGAANYRGAELAERGIPFPVLPRDEVINHALQLARQIAEKPRASLIILKDHLVAPLRKELPLFVKREVVMHKQTIRHYDVKKRINLLFGR